MNCGAGPAASLDAIEAMGSPVEGEPARSIMPNAGLSQRLEGRFVYAASPEYFGTVTAAMLAAGARIVGGCCGTTPDHIAAMRAALDVLETTDPGLVRASTRRRRPSSRRPTRPSLAGVASDRDTDDGAPRPTRLAELLDGRAFRRSRSRSTRHGASGSSGPSRPPGSCATPGSTSSTSPTRRWPGCG